MEQRSQRTWVNLSFFVFAAIMGILASTLASRLAVTFDLEAKTRALSWWIRGIGFLVGGSLFVGLIRNRDANQFLSEVVTELSSVIWPSQQEVTRSTSIVIIMVLISGMLLGVLDFLCGKLVQLVL